MKHLPKPYPRRQAPSQKILCCVDWAGSWSDDTRRFLTTSVSRVRSPSGPPTPLSATPSFCNRRIASEGSINARPNVKGKQMVDMKSYAGRRFVKVDDVRDGPIEGTIVDISEGEFEKLNLTLDTGDTLSLNKTNTTKLLRAFGTDSDRAIGQMVRLLFGEIKYQNRMQEAVILEPIKIEEKAKGTDDPDDDPPF
jgi:hypothetical protein